jgi:hypothetical protein
VSARRALGALTLLWLPLVGACSAPELGDLPALCSGGECPDGYDCVHGVCAKPGMEVPIGVKRLSYLRGVDLKLVPETSSVIVAYQSYSYSPDGEGIVGLRVTPDGAVSAPMYLARGFQAYEGVVEPHYDVLGLPGRRLLVAVSTAPLPEEEREEGSAASTPATAQLRAYTVQLPPEGDEASGADYAQAWPRDVEVDTVGYGAVTRPKLLARGDGRVELGYVRSSRAHGPGGAALQLVAELAVFPMMDDGSLRGRPTLREVRRGMAVAVGVVSAFSCAGAAWWVLDEMRPSAVLVLDGDTKPHAELRLAGRAGIPVEAGPLSLLYFTPSERIGNKLPSSSGSGEIVFHDVLVAPVQRDPPWVFSDRRSSTPPAPGSLLPVVRDTPRPAWVTRGDKPPLLVTPGADIDAPELIVYVVDPESNSAREARRIARMSSAPLRATEAVVVGGKLYVAWLDGTEAASTIRMAVVPEP